FVIAILSEHRSVTRELRLLKDCDPPLGLALAAVAISEGADVDSTLTEEVVRDLCDVVRADADYKGGIGDRLFASVVKGWGWRQARAALLPFMAIPGLEQYTDLLKRDLLQLAYRFGGSNSCAVEDLRELQSHLTLAQIAFDHDAPFLVRADAAKSMLSSGITEESYRAFGDLAVAAAGDPKNWAGLIGVLAGLGDAELYATLAERGVIADSHFGHLLDALKEDLKLTVLETLATDARLSVDKQLLIRLHTTKDSEYITKLLPSLADKPHLIEFCLDAMIRSGNRSALLQAALRADVALVIRARSVRMLKKLDAQEELKEIVAAENLPFALRRQSAEYLYKYLSKLHKLPPDRNLASFLLHFFDSMGSHSEQPVILQRRSFLNYILNHYTEAISLFDRLLKRRPATSWELGVLGHCLELLGRREEALGAYTQALRLEPRHVFARCRCACIHWECSNYALALIDVEQIDIYGIYGAPKWFQPFAGDILREGGRLEEAEKWLNFAVRDDPAACLRTEGCPSRFSTKTSRRRGQ